MKLHTSCVSVVITILLAVFGWADADKDARSSGSGGSLPFDEISELLAQRPELAQFIAEHLEVGAVGIAPRIGRNGKANEEVVGIRIPPFKFPAKSKGASGDFNLTLIVDAEAAYVDDKGKPTSLLKATDVRMNLTGIRLLPGSPIKK